MMARTWTGAPFGVSIPRFGTDGIHPKNLTAGTFVVSERTAMATNPDVGPGKYDVDNGPFSAKAVASRASGPGWAREYELANVTAIPYLLNKEYWQAQKILPRNLGPGKYGLVDPRQDKPVSGRGILSTRGQRFAEESRSCAPGPGTYGYPDQQLVENSKKSAGTRGMLEGSTGERSLPLGGCPLGPGQYSVETIGGVDELLNKRCSTRGPYDLFSLDRSKLPFFATENRNKLPPNKYEFRTFIDELDGRHRKKHGEFRKADRTPRVPCERVFFNLASYPHDPALPGPASYDIRDSSGKPLTVGQKLPPFLSSAKRDSKAQARLFNGSHNPVGIGRYDIQKVDDCRHVDAHVNIFVSKTGRPNVEKNKFIQERIRSTNIPPTERRECGVSINWFDQNKSSNTCRLGVPLSA